MPKKYGCKEKDQVVAHVVNLLLTGKLRTGDRLDRNELAEELGLSKMPVQEAVIQLEHDGVLSTRYHRGAFVERFDEQVVLENYELYGVLNGIASARAAADPSPDLLSELNLRLDALCAAAETKSFHEHAMQYRRTINDAHAGPRLHAAIRAAQTFMPQSYWSTYLGSHDEILPYYEVETVAVRAGDPDAARAACVHRSEVMGRIMLNELIRRRVLGPGSDAGSIAAEF